MKVAGLWKVGAIAAVVVLLVTVGAYAWFSATRPAVLGLPPLQVRTPAPSSGPSDRLAATCRLPAIPATTPSADLSGVWVIQPGSEVGYRAHEKFVQLPSPHDAVARTDRVKGWLLVAAGGTTVQIQTGCVAVELASLTSIDKLPGFDVSSRDYAVRGLLSTDEFPYAVFQPYPSSLSADLSSRRPVHVQISGALELSGKSNPVQFGLDVKVQDSQVLAAGNSTVDIKQFGVEVSRGPQGFVSVDSRFILEISLVLLKA